MLQQGPRPRRKLLPEPGRSNLAEGRPARLPGSGYLQNQLISRGVRMTRQRRVILGVIESARVHLDAAAILQFAQQQDEGIDRVTVYRTLNLLKRHHLIDELDLLHLEGGRHFYEQRPLSEHMHLACLRCGRVMEFSSALLSRIKGQIQRERGFRVDFARIEIGGHCKKCQEGLRD